MHVAAEHLQHLDDVIDIVVEIEAALGERNHARVGPVGDVDFMRRQERLDRAAQQRRVMAGHRRHDQHARMRCAQRPGQLAIEMQQTAERLFPDRADLDRRAHAVDFGGVEAPFGLAVTARGALEQFAGRGDRFAEFGVRPGIQRILKQDLGGVGHGARRVERRVAHFVHPVHRRRERRTAFGHQGRCAAKLTNRHFCSDPCFAPQHTAECVIKRQCDRSVDLRGQNAKNPGNPRETSDLFTTPEQENRGVWRCAKGQGRSQMRQRTAPR